MAFRHHVVAALIAHDPETARKRILAAFVKANASRRAAASVLGCRRSTFQAWVKRLGMEEVLDQVEEIAKRDGWHHGRRGGAGWHRNRRASETSGPF